MGLETVFMIGGALLGGASAYKSYQAQKAATRTANRQANYNRQRDTMSQLRQQQLMRAQMMASAGGAGVLDSSGMNQGLGALSSQTYGNISATSTNSLMSTQINNYNAQAQKWGSIGQIGMQAFNFGYGEYQSQRQAQRSNALFLAQNSM